MPHTLDVHGLRGSEALLELERFLARAARHGYRGKLRLVHGYGSRGQGGTLRDKLRVWLTKEGWDFLCGELTEGNPGLTIIRLEPSQPSATKSGSGIPSARAVTSPIDRPFARQATPSADLPPDIDPAQVARLVLDVCKIPRSLPTILGRLRRFGDPVVRAALDDLIKQRMLRTIIKGKVKRYWATKELTG
ncbi:MAG TPA: Smr/MutS family protein [Pirellulaceae bacterium]